MHCVSFAIYRVVQEIHGGYDAEEKLLKQSFGPQREFGHVDQLFKGRGEASGKYACARGTFARIFCMQALTISLS